MLVLRATTCQETALNYILPVFTHRPLSSSFLGLPYRILNINHKKELLSCLWVCTLLARYFFWLAAGTFFWVICWHFGQQFTLRISSQIHGDVLKRILKAPIDRFFDKHPVGRIMNRMSADLVVVDLYLCLGCTRLSTTSLTPAGYPSTNLSVCLPGCLTGSLSIYLYEPLSLSLSLCLCLSLSLSRYLSVRLLSASHSLSLSLSLSLNLSINLSILIISYLI